MKGKRSKALLSAPLKSVLNFTFAPFIYYRNYKAKGIGKEHAIKTDAGIQSVEPLVLGGLDQWILIRGEHQDNPLMLFLHGGPGLPLMPFHRINASIEEHFTVIHWDQRGSGKSFYSDIPPETMTLDQLLSDTYELIQYLLKRFNRKKLYLVGYSCGSVLGMKTVAKYPELFEAYIGIGQIINMQESESISHQYAIQQAREAQNNIALKELELIGEPPYKSHRSMLEQRMWINTFGGFFRQGIDNIKFYRTGFMSPDYSITDIRKLFKGIDYTSKHLWNAFYQTNLVPLIPKLEVPVFFLAGKHDYVVPQSVLEKFYHQLEAPLGKELIWFDHSAHWPFLEEPQRFHEVLCHIHETAQKRNLSL
jgi:pimeloyl-ACP methyl ester carboxylesterase